MRRATVLGLSAIFSLANLAGQSANAQHKPVEHVMRPPTVGWYIKSADSGSRLVRYAQHGMRLIVSYGGSVDQVSALLQNAQAAGLSVLLMPNTSWMHGNDWSDLRRSILQFRDSPALYGWYLADEPEYVGLSPKRLAHAYRVIKSLDRHPVAVVFTEGSCRFGARVSKAYLKGFDILMFDDYPFYGFMHSHRDSVNGIREFRRSTRNCVATAHRYHKRGPFMVMQGFGKGIKDGPFSYRDPTYYEEKTMFRVAIRNGAHGILFWSDQFADRTVTHNVSRIVGAWHRQMIRRGLWQKSVPSFNAGVASDDGDEWSTRHSLL